VSVVPSIFFFALAMCRVCEQLLAQDCVCRISAATLCILPLPLVDASFPVVCRFVGAVADWSTEVEGLLAVPSCLGYPFLVCSSCRHVRWALKSQGFVHLAASLMPVTSDVFQASSCLTVVNVALCKDPACAYRHDIYAKHSLAAKTTMSDQSAHANLCHSCSGCKSFIKMRCSFSYIPAHFDMCNAAQPAGQAQNFHSFSNLCGCHICECWWAGQLNSLGVIKHFADVVGGKLVAMNLGWQPVFGLLNVCYFGLHYMFASQTAHVGALYSAFLAMMLAAGTLTCKLLS